MDAALRSHASSRSSDFSSLPSGVPNAPTRWPRAPFARHGERGGLKLVVGLALAADPEHRAEALPWLEEALKLGAPGPGKVHLEIAALLLESGRAAEAVVHLREAERLLPDIPEVYYRLGTALRTTGDLDGARAALRRYQELSRSSDTADWDSKEAGTELNEIQALANENRLSEALKRVEEMIGKYPGEDRALGLKAKVLFSMGRKVEALSTAVAAQELMPSRVEHHYLEGLFLTYLGRLDEAEEALGRALALDETRGEAHELLARLGASRGRFDEAAEHFRKALDAGTDGAELRRAYAEVLKRLGREEESEEQMAAYRRQEGR